MDIFGRIISVDDHVVEPPRLWQDRLPRKYQDVGPRGRPHGASDAKLGSGKVSARFVASDPDRKPCDWWLYEDMQRSG